MSSSANRSIFRYELAGMIFITILGSLLHFTFEWSNYQPIVGAFSAVNESVLGAFETRFLADIALCNHRVQTLE